MLMSIIKFSTSCKIIGYLVSIFLSYNCFISADPISTWMGTCKAVSHSVENFNNHEAGHCEAGLKKCSSLTTYTNYSF